MSEQSISAWVCVVASILKNEKYFHSNLLEAQNVFFCVGFLLLMLLHPSSGEFWLLSPSHKKQPVRAQQHLFFCSGLCSVSILL